MEDVHYTVQIVEHGPSALCQTLCLTCRHASGLEPCLYVLSDRPNVSVGGPIRDNKEVGHVRHTAHIEDHDLGGLEVFGEGGGATSDGFARRGGARGHRRGAEWTSSGGTDTVPTLTLKVAQ
jgi:hypothetical protein